jgi:hypothetical protein
MVATNSQKFITEIDNWLDEKPGIDYSDQPLAQDWARVAKITEEAGEAIAELILWTGQNPRKPQDPEAKERMLKELCDVILTGWLALQHFTKDAEETEARINGALVRTYERMLSPDSSSRGRKMRQN